MFFDNTQAAKALRKIARDVAKTDGADPIDLMNVGTDLIAYSLNYYDEHSANSAADVATLYRAIAKKFTDAGAPTPFEYGILCGAVFGGLIKYIEKLGRLDTQAKERVKILVDAAVGALGGVAPLLPAAAIFLGGGITVIGDVITTYVMGERKLRSAALKLIGRFLADGHRAAEAAAANDPERYAVERESWRQVKEGLELSLLCAGLR